MGSFPGNPNTSVFTTKDANGNTIDANGNIVAAANQATGSLGDQITTALQNGVSSIKPGNTNQVQGGVQQGQFDSSGQNAQTQDQTTSQNTTQNQTGSNYTMQSAGQGQTTVGQQATTGSEIGQTTSTGQTTGNSQNFGQTSTNVNDSLGLGKLLSDQAGMATTNDKNRTAALTNIMQNGDSSLNNQVGAAVNNALSGPGMQGTGDSAQARAAGYAAANVQRSNVADQLAAAQQLGGGTATTNLANAGNAYLGSTQNTNNLGSQTQSTNNVGATNTQNNSNTSNNNISNAVSSSASDSGSSSSGTSSTLGSTLSNLLANNSSSGTSSAQNAQAAYGTTPQQSSSSGGGSVVCTVLGERGWIPRWILEAELEHVRKHAKGFWYAAKGYLLWGVPLAKLARRSKLVSLICLPFAKACSYEAARRARNDDSAQQNVLPKFLWPQIAYYTFIIMNSVIGLFIPGKPEVKDPELKQLLSDSGLELDMEDGK